LLLVEGGKTGKANKTFPDSLLSNSAYMLVYDSMSEVDAVPTQPYWLGPLVDAKNTELANEDSTLRSEDVTICYLNLMQKYDTLFKERMNDEWTKNKGYVADIMSTINVGHGEDMTGDLIPLKWLNMWAESPRLEENLDTSSLLCPHKKLAFNKVFMTRLVSIKAVILKLNQEKNQ